MTGRAGLAGGAGTLALVGAACALAWRDGSPVVPRAGGLATGGSAGTFLLLLAIAFAAYAAGLVLVRRLGAPFAATVVLAAAIQLAPLAAPLLLSTDAWTYWAYGWIAARGGANPYVDVPESVPGNPALPHMGAAWVDTTSVYGPAFTLLSEPLALAAGSSSDTAAWTYKAIGGASVLAAALLAGRLSRRRSLAVALVGWNPVLAIHLAGGGHNDALLGALLMAALALAAARRLQAAGVVWALAVLVKWVPLLFLGLRALEARASGRRTAHAGFAAAFVAIAALGTWRYGLHWPRAFLPLADNVALETSYAVPHRLEQAGLPHGAALVLAGAAFLVGLAWLVQEARRGRARLGLAACLVLVTSPYLAVWYLGWAVPLAAGDDDDDLASLVAVALTAYLLPQAIPV